MRYTKIFLLAALSSTITSAALACTDVKLTAKDGTIFIARSMEFASPLNSSIRTSTHNRKFTTTAPSGKPGLSWDARFGYVYLDGFGIDVALDGMNEAGLSFEYLYLPGETQYQNVPAGNEAQALSYAQFGDWVLSNFKTIDEVKQALNSVYVFPEKIAALGDAILPAHASITDSTGKGIIIEFVGGQKKVYDSVGIMTNSPQYDWQVTNLRNYINLTSNSPAPITSGNFTFIGTGQGAGAVGLPGDFSPPSRFVKTSFLAKNAYQGNTGADTLNLAQHILNNVDIPAGVSKSTLNGKEMADTTEWVVFKDITNKVLYYKSYGDLSLRQVTLSKLDFSDKAPRLEMPISNNQTVIEMTDTLKKAK